MKNIEKYYMIFLKTVPWFCKIATFVLYLLLIVSVYKLDVFFTIVIIMMMIMSAFIELMVKDIIEELK